MKLLLTNDLHLAHKGPVSRLDDWQETCFGKLDQIARLARKLDVEAILIAGDIFHRKGFIAYATLARLMCWCFDLKTHDKIAVYAIAGNHDERYNRLDSVGDLPLGILFHSGAMVDVSENTLLLQDGVVLSGIPYPNAVTLQGYEFLRDPVPGQMTHIAMAHTFATPAGGTFFGQPGIAYHDLLQFPVDIWHFGHDHSDNGVVTITRQDVDPPTDVQFVNIGALTRGGLAHDQLTRVVKVALVDTRTGPVKQIALTVAPVEEVFDLERKAQIDRDHAQIEAFVEHLSSHLLDVRPETPLDQHVTALHLPDQVRDLVQTYLAEAEACAD